MYWLCSVTPFAGVWIEIGNICLVAVYVHVTPFGGGGIDIEHQGVIDWEKVVTPFAGVWIEIARHYRTGTVQRSHSLRGSVD